MLKSLVEFPARVNDASRPSPLNPRGDALLAAALPFGVEISRLSEAYKCCQTVATATVVAIPTTTSRLTMWNGEPDDGKSYVIEGVHSIAVAGAVASAFTIVGMINRGRQTQPSQAQLVLRSTNGALYLGRGSVHITTTNLADAGWFPLHSSVVNVGTASAIGLGAYAEVRGGIILPPGGLFSISVVTNSATITQRGGIRWQEVQLPLARSI